MMNNQTLTFKVKKNSTLKDCLKSFGFSSSFLPNLKGKIKVNEKDEYFNHICKKNDIITVDVGDNASSSFLPQQSMLFVVFEDENILVINKPFEIATITSKGHQINTLSNFVLQYLQEKTKNVIVRPVNRLDICTKGLVVFAKNAYVQNLFSKPKFDIKKYYIAKVVGKTKKFGKIKLPIAKDEQRPSTYKVCKNGKSAITIYKRLNYDKTQNISTVKIKLVTGRTHQIRFILQIFVTALSVTLGMATKLQQFRQKKLRCVLTKSFLFTQLLIKK